MTIKLKLPKLTELKPRIAVVGVGGAGGNAINNMIASGLQGVSFIAANTDAQALLASSAEHRIQLGVNVTEGLGAGSRPEIGEAAAEEAVEEIRSHVSGAHMVFIAAGMGGGTGTGASAVVARIAREEKALTVGIVTKPFQFEGARRMRVAEAGIAELKKQVDTLIVIPNQNLFRIANERTTFAEAFVLADQVLYSGIACIVDVIVREGLINLDFADVRTVLAGMGNAMMGMGEAEGERRALDAAEEAIANPLLDDVSLKGAKGLLISITGGRDLTLYEVDEAASRIRQEVDPEANIIMGATFDEALDSRVRVSIVASGMGEVAAHASGSSQGGARSLPPPPQSAPPQQPVPAVDVSLAPTGGATPPPAPLGPAAVHAAQSESDALDLHHRLSAAFETHAVGEAETPPAPDGPLVFGTDASQAPGQAPQPSWRGPGDVMIEEGLPQFVARTAPQPHAPFQPQAQPSTQGGFESPQQQPAPASQHSFQPAPPQEIRRGPPRRLPDIEDFPAVGQRELRAKAGERGGAQPAQHGGREPAPGAGKPAARKPGLFERLTGRGPRGDSVAGGGATGPKPSSQGSGKRVPNGAQQGDQQGGQQGSQTRGASGGERVDLPDFFEGRRR